MAPFWPPDHAAVLRPHAEPQALEKSFYPRTAHSVIPGFKLLNRFSIYLERDSNILM
jgi:hypothetical protein